MVGTLVCLNECIHNLTHNARALDAGIANAHSVETQSVRAITGAGERLVDGGGALVGS